jgi:hypothetical protein
VYIAELERCIFHSKQQHNISFKGSLQTPSQTQHLFKGSLQTSSQTQHLFKGSLQTPSQTPIPTFFLSQ